MIYVERQGSHENGLSEQYISTYGLHFTDDLCKHASGKMVNDNGTEHTWNTDDVQAAMDRLGYTKPAGSTIADITYTANMCYADFYGTVINTEDDCIKYAMSVANDKDGYEGIQFCRWLTDVEHKQSKIDWEKFI